MSADPETVAAIIGHLDSRLSQQDELRAVEFRNVYKKIDDHALKSEAAIQSLAIQIVKVDTTLDGHIKVTNDRFLGISDKAKARSDRQDGWLKVVAASLLAGVVGWLSSHFGSGSK